MQTGWHVSLARIVDPVPVTSAGGPVGAPARMPAPVLQTIAFGGTSPVGVTDTLIVNTHSAGLTHLDALAHIPVDGRVYPGVPIDEAVTPHGVCHGSPDPFGGGILTRGILLDLAPDDLPLAPERRIGVEDLDAALQRTGAELHPGGAVVVRAAWDTDLLAGEPVPGLDLSGLPWLRDHDVSIRIGDVGDPRPAAARLC